MMTQCITQPQFGILSRIGMIQDFLDEELFVSQRYTVQFLEMPISGDYE